MQETPANRAVNLKVVADLKVGTTTGDPFDEVDI
jgi:hypothetical protein